jgi:serine/threonine protein phosphatase PrpC
MVPTRTAITEKPSSGTQSEAAINDNMNWITIGGATHPGMVKENNQDSHAYYIPRRDKEKKKGALMALADGMGGHSGGEIASRLTLDVIKETYYSDTNPVIIESLKNAVLRANETVISRGESDLKLEGMGSTLTAVVLNKNRLYFAHVGDSRGYIIHKDSIAQFTEDHSYVASLVKAGVITEEEAKNHPDDNIITRAIGIEKNLLVDSAEWHEKLKKSQYILICCDGLYKVVTDEEILEMVNKYPAPDAICEKLVEKANENGGPDNITVMAARINKTGLISDLFNR